MLVTCYSEGAAGIRGTLDSLSATTYNDKYKVRPRKLLLLANAALTTARPGCSAGFGRADARAIDGQMLFIVTDGIIKGAGETQSTPQLCLGMLDIAPELRNPAPRSYVAIADGEKQHNTAKVVRVPPQNAWFPTAFFFGWRQYAGWYRYKPRSVPAVLVVKCGTPKEVGGPKPGNRGKRDSQVMVMSFLSRVIFDDRMTEFDYDLFWKVQYLMGVTPDRFELVLMVDADTTVRPGSMSYMIKAMDKNPMIMGLCGETCIANKHDSWIVLCLRSVFEYHISHHLSKAFESVFGGVTCLPGCFSMYRIKARKNGAWVPILANPDVVQEYSQNEVETLHKKNLLLLGEDRFLSTLMLRNFPKRQMVFVPQAKCKTVVPSTFRVLLSQRRRWINSTVHNLLELVLVKDLCGIACLSMQFVVLVELLGTVLLPVAVVVAFALAATLIASPGPVEMMSLFVPAVVLGLPAVFVLTTSLKLEYIFWMLVYLVSLPVWNFVLPLYAFWHFDDFSWGQTRVVAGERGGPDRRRQHHGAKEGEFDTSAITMRRWSEWEVERRGALVANVLREHSPYFAAKRSSDVPLQDVPPLPAAV
ncbi:MAG: chitin synthase-domain-containing protein [Olpidium bornovanus]|uniref:chitin synthase n=1 Tax=Olpidium bornovanus TaxID=278681 RepID=A0A8H7ZYI7_9FUNG|nr:MAG: chitin synthase-domain-containing protein [Olpidium bornovanus]